MDNIPTAQMVIRSLQRQTYLDRGLIAPAIPGAGDPKVCIVDPNIVV